MTPSYVDEVARAIRQHVDPGLVPSGDVDLLFVFYAVLALTRGTDTSAPDVHDAWTAWMTVTGQHHESMRPYAELPDDVKAEDEPYVAAIRAVAAQRAIGS